MKLITEVIESVDFLTENTKEGKVWKIGGKFLHGGLLENRNKRLYPMPILDNATQVYIENYVKKGRALGELNHPQTPQLNPERACIVIQELSRRSSDDGYDGVARIIERSPLGQIVIGILESGGNIGVSSRALGSLVKNNQGINEVQSDLKFSAIDVVSDPSGLDCWTSLVSESLQEWDILEDGRIVQIVVDAHKKKADESKLLNQFAQVLLEINKKYK